jgi:hypothetical protein
VPYLKFSRDKRGYEHFSLVEPSNGRRGKSSRPRVLFWFRTPPQIKVGREPFPDDVRRAVEAQNPGLTFDWARLMATPIPSADAEHWRERRRAEKAARQVMRESGDANDAGQDGQVGQDRQDGEEKGDDEDVLEADGLAPAEAALSASESHEPSSAPLPEPGGEPPSGGRRRRRRGRRKRHQTAGSSSGTAGAASAPAASNVPVPPSEEV